MEVNKKENFREMLHSNKMFTSNAMGDLHRFSVLNYNGLLCHQLTFVYKGMSSLELALQMKKNDMHGRSHIYYLLRFVI